MTTDTFCVTCHSLGYPQNDKRLHKPASECKDCRYAPEHHVPAYAKRHRYSLVCADCGRSQPFDDSDYDAPCDAKAGQPLEA